MQRPASPQEEKKKETKNLPAANYLSAKNLHSLLSPLRVVSEETRPPRSPNGREKVPVKKLHRRAETETGLDKQIQHESLNPTWKKAPRTFILCFSARLRQLKEREREKKSPYPQCRGPSSPARCMNWTHAPRGLLSSHAEPGVKVP